MPPWMRTGQVEFSQGLQVKISAHLIHSVCEQPRHQDKSWYFTFLMFRLNLYISNKSFLIWRSRVWVQVWFEVSRFQILLAAGLKSSQTNCVLFPGVGLSGSSHGKDVRLQKAGEDPCKEEEGRGHGSQWEADTRRAGQSLCGEITCHTPHIHTSLSWATGASR